MSEQQTPEPVPPAPPPEPAPAPYAPLPPPVSSRPPAAPPGTPPPVLPTAIGAGGTAGLLYQFTGSAGWACLVGVITIAVPFIFNRVFFFLPIIGLIPALPAFVPSRERGAGVRGAAVDVV